MLCDPQQPDVAFAVTVDGLYCGVRDGYTPFTWTRVDALPSARAAYALLHHPATGFLLGGDSTRVLQSETGETWRALAPLLQGDAVLSVAIAQQNDQPLLLAGTDGSELFVSQNGGRSWQLVHEVGKHLWQRFGSRRGMRR